MQGGLNKNFLERDSLRFLFSNPSIILRYIKISLGNNKLIAIIDNLMEKVFK